MPEGDTVRNTAMALTTALAGQVIERSDFRIPTLATASVSGWRVVECASRGKHLLLRMISPTGTTRTLHSHLRMDGSWRTFRTGERWRGGPAHTIRVVLITPRSTAVGYHLHDVSLIPTAQESSVIGHLGPDLLGDDWAPEEAIGRLLQRPDRPISDALLDQTNLAGIGNLYKSELLFLRGIWPFTPVASVDDLRALVTLAQRLISSNVGRWTQATTGSTRKGEENYVYGRAGRPCRRCGTLIHREYRGDDERSTYWCPSCQPEPPQ